MTQEEQIKKRLLGKIRTIKQLFDETKILEPNIRRILGQGVKRGKFIRIARGVYTLGDITVVTGDSVEILPHLAKQGFKANFIFLDIPYRTPAVVGGNRGIKYYTIQPYQFRIITDALKKIVASPYTPIVYMYSQAPSGMAKMKEYNDCLIQSGFKVAKKGLYYKYYNDGRTRCTNMRGDVIEPERLMVYSKSGIVKALSPLKLTFHCVRPRGYQTEKSQYLLGSFIKQLTKAGQVILDPFLGSGVTLMEAMKQKRKALGIEIREDVIANYVLPKLERVCS